MLNINDLVINEKLTIDHMYYWINKDWIRPVEFVVDRKSEKYLSDHFPIVGKFLWNM